VHAIIPFLLLVPCALAQSVPVSRVTFSGGFATQIKRYQSESATGLGISYGYRFYKYIEAEGGLFTALDPTGEICSHNGCVDVNDRFFWLPFGVRLIAPLYLGRIEFSGGGGGL